MFQVKISQSQYIISHMLQVKMTQVKTSHFICLSACKQHYSHGYEWIAGEFYGNVKGIFHSQVASTPW